MNKEKKTPIEKRKAALAALILYIIIETFAARKLKKEDFPCDLSRSSLFFLSASPSLRRFLKAERELIASSVLTGPDVEEFHEKLIKLRTNDRLSKYLDLTKLIIENLPGGGIKDHDHFELLLAKILIKDYGHRFKVDRRFKSNDFFSKLSSLVTTAPELGAAWLEAHDQLLKMFIRKELSCKSINHFTY